MNIVKKGRLLLFALLVFVALVGFFMLEGALWHKKDIDKLMNTTLVNAQFPKIQITDRNGQLLFDGSLPTDKRYVEDGSVSRAFAPLLGINGVGYSSGVVWQAKRDTPKHGLLTGYSVPTNRTIALTADVSLQKAAQAALDASGYDGCIIVLDYYTGEVRAMATSPVADPTNTRNFSGLKAGTLKNKATQVYVTGSVMKAVTVAAILELHPEAAEEFRFKCTGTYQHISCDGGKKKHGNINLEKALYQSCNCAISAAAEQYLSPQEFRDFVQKVGLLDSDILLDYPLDSESPATIDPENDFLWTVDGQGATLLTPASIAGFYGAIANNGVRVPIRVRTDTVGIEGEILFSEQTAQWLRTALTKGVRDYYGVLKGVKAAGKTGTAQRDNAPSHSWFVCDIVDSRYPTYTVLCMLEGGGSSSNARTVACKFITKYITK